MKTLEVKVLRIKWPKEGVENPYDNYILETDKGPAKGKIKWRPAINELLKLHGDYTEWRGMKQFSFKFAELNIPIDSRSQLKYVCERALGIGERTENAIWEKLGDDWKSINSKIAEELKIKSSAFENLKNQIANLETDKEKADTISWLMSKGCTSGSASTAWEVWEKDAIGIVNDNPYRLAELPHYGFKDVDGDVRRCFEIDDNDERRLQAAVIYCLKQLTSSGSTVIHWQQLFTMLSNLQLNLELATNCVTKMMQEKSLWGFPSEMKIALINHYNAEIAILNYLGDK